ncbi:MAG: hypothetical protein AB1491_03215 [Thermodesulfobacteriota bacterium]
MANAVYRVWNPKEYLKAGPTDIVELLPVPGHHPLFLVKWVVDTLVYGIVHREIIHLSGPTGTAKSSLLEALYLVPENFRAVCEGLGFSALPLKLYAIEMCKFETPGELYSRRALKAASTFDEKSCLIEALEDAAGSSGSFFPLIWLREIGRCHSASVQSGLLNLMFKGDIILPDGRRLNGEEIAWVADSNYQAEHEAVHTLVTLDTALKRRFTINLTLNYLSAAQEAMILEYLLRRGHSYGGNGIINKELIMKIVELGGLIRQQQTEGNLRSVPPPTIYGYQAFLRMAQNLRHLSLPQVALATLLGNASLEDQQVAAGVLNQVFGLRTSQEDDSTLWGHLF